jgi:hypothetical protein
VTTTEDDKKILKKIKYLERSLKKNSLSQTKKKALESMIKELRLAVSLNFLVEINSGHDIVKLHNRVVILCEENKKEIKLRLTICCPKIFDDKEFKSLPINSNIGKIIYLKKRGNIIYIHGEKARIKKILYP